MTLDEWMSAANVSNGEMARRCGKSTSTISRIRRKLEKPEPDLAVKISYVTNGDVTPNDLYLKPKPKKRRAA